MAASNYNLNIKLSSYVQMIIILNVTVLRRLAMAKVYSMSLNYSRH